MGRFLEQAPTLAELMRAFALGAYGPEPTSLRNSEPGRIGSPHPPHPPGHRQGAYRLAHDDRGFRYACGTVGPALWLLQAYRRVGVDPARSRAFRSAVLAWTVLTDSHSMAEVLRASHLAGMGTDEERAVLSRDGARLHLWARRVLAPDLVMALPHHTAYDRPARFYSHHFKVAVPDDIVRTVAAVMQGTEVHDVNGTLAKRVDATRQWLERFGEAVAAPSRRSTQAISPPCSSTPALTTPCSKSLLPAAVSALQAPVG